MTDQLEQRLPKPPYGDPCNGCGLCCLSEQCSVSLEIFGEEDVCPALERLGDRLVCGLMVHPLTWMIGLPPEKGPLWAEFFRLGIGSGTWCDSVDVRIDDPRLAERTENIRLLERADDIAAMRERQKQLKPWE